MSVEASKTVDQFFQDNPSVKFIRFQWVDYSGVLRARFIPEARCRHLASGEDRCTLAQNCMVIPVSTAPRCWPDGIEEWSLIPDWESLVVCGFAPAHASVMCATACGAIPDVLERCPRSALRRALQAFDGFCPGSQLLMGFEIEFSLLDESYSLAKSMDETVGYSMIAGLRTENMAIIEDILAALSVSGIGVHHFHVETTDQYEIALSAMPPMEAIDSLIMAMETIRTVGLRHNRRATMAPRPVLSGPLSGCHMHLSIVPELPAAPSFLAGVLERLEPLCAFGLPNYDSYCRVAGDCAGEWIGWGTGNKDLPIRGVSSSRWEFRFLDATANIYLFAAALISAGVAGIRENTVLKITDCQVVPSALTQDEAAKQLLDYGITKRMPTSLQQSLDAADCDEQLREWVGSGLLFQYLRVKRKEVEYFAQMAEEDRRKKLLGYF
ncbi:hypothetical protein ACHAPT_006150 [Fusarium lateritium]